ncbi:hypothetical protein ORV05_14175 [Amycolatopsis cynarae]|uniref:DUF2867 domain-containing protein n=1 Tax=Amycolatopsis cynarae TaxID=2995223 RepID=A0ABY7BE10_9PSEU|nr:hypothetical protein [Amycolatopsis sp. HUAS 11-8]WAL68858.1 hypothetical protein ORV05_14175 [Amycolatopsis sp. HUAS 11-8]
MTLLDETAPLFDFALREHLVVDAVPELTYQAMNRQLEESRPRLIPDFARPLRPRRGVPGFDEILAGARWVELGRRPGAEILLGAAGRFWTPYMEWQSVTLSEFRTFSRPRRARLAVSLSVCSYGVGQSLLTFEARALTTDRVAYHWADWYWHIIKPTARVVVRGLLRRIRHAAAPVPVSP